MARKLANADEPLAVVGGCTAITHFDSAGGFALSQA